MSVYTQLLTLLLSSKKGDELPVITSLSNNGKIIVYDPNTELISTIIKENLTLSNQGGNSTKINITVDFNGQVNFNLTNKPDNIDLIINRVEQEQDVDYTYNNQNGDLVITNTSVGNAIKTTTSIYARGYSNSLAKKEKLIIPSAGHATYNLIEKPSSIDLKLNRVPLTEGTDYTYDASTGDIVITNSSYANTITLNSALIARKFY